MRTKSLARWAALAALFAAPVAFADDPEKEKDTSKPETSKTAMKLSDGDVQMLAHYHDGNQMEIQIGTLAEKQAGSKAVKTYAKMIVDDHKSADRKIVAFAKKHNVTIPKATASSEVEQKEMNEQKSALDRLKAMKGSDFDREYMKDMEADHDKEVANVETMAAKAQNPDLQQMIRDMKPVLQRHADEARNLAKSMSGNDSSKSPDMAQPKSTEPMQQPKAPDKDMPGQQPSPSSSPNY
jgi:putative membrane protein